MVEEKYGSCTRDFLSFWEAAKKVLIFRMLGGKPFVNPIRNGQSHGIEAEKGVLNALLEDPQRHSKNQTLTKN